MVLTVWTAMVGFLFCFDFVPVHAGCYDLKCGHSIFYMGLVFVEVAPDVPGFCGSDGGCGSGGHFNVIEKFDSDKGDYFHHVDRCIIGYFFNLLECQVFNFFVKVWSSVEAFFLCVDNLASWGLLYECPYYI